MSLHITLQIELHVNAGSQTSQGYDFPPVCIHIWPTKCDISENAYPQNAQEYGFSPLCVRMCIFKSELLKKCYFTQTWYLTSVCEYIFVKWNFRKILIYTLYTNKVSHQCENAYEFLKMIPLKMLIHTQFMYKISLLCVLACAFLKMMSVKTCTLYMNKISLLYILACIFLKMIPNTVPDFTRKWFLCSMCL